MKKNVIVDLDAGSDDALALLLLLTSEIELGYKVVGVTCTHGNTDVDYVCANVLRTLETIGRQDVPVFRGAESPLLTLEDQPGHTYWHGRDGFGDNNFPPPKGTIQKENAIVALNRLASENEECALICLGPLTNAALVLRTYPEFSKNIKEIFIMGGNVSGIGNVVNCAEFNFWADPEAAHIVLTTAKCPITILPWEPCITPDISMEWRTGILGKIPTAHIQLLNVIEFKLYKSQTRWNPCDAFLAAAFITDGVIKKSRQLHLTVELGGRLTRGQTVVDHKQEKPPNAKIIDEIDFDLFKKMVLKMGSYEPGP